MSRRTGPVLLIFLGLLAVALLMPERSGKALTRLPSKAGPILAEDRPAPLVDLAGESEDSSTDRDPVEAPARPILLEGYVQDHPAGKAHPEGAPAVFVSGREGFLGGMDLESVETDEEGRFRLQIGDPLRRPLSFSLFVEGSELLRGASADLKLGEDEFEARGIVLDRYPKGDLHGVAVDLRERPLAGVQLLFHEEGSSREAVSGGEGRFQLRNAGWFSEIEARREGFLLAKAERPKELPQGGWEPMQVVLAATGRLRALVQEGDVPLSGAMVSLKISELERFGARFEFGSLQAPLQAETNQDGLALFDQVWADVRLVVEVRSGADIGTPFRGERARDGLLQFGEDAEGVPLVVAPGGELELRAIIPSVVRLRGRVEDETGQPIPNPHVSLVSLEKPPGDDLPLQAFGDSEGRFTLEVPTQSFAGRVVISGSDQLAMFGVGDENARIASCIVDLASAPTRELVLVLQPGLTIRGRLLVPDGTGVGGRVFALPPGPPFLTGKRVAHASKKDGSFVLKGLPAGIFDLQAQPSEVYAQTMVRGVQAGRQNVEIVLEQERSARVELKVDVRDAEPEQIIVLRARLHPRGEPPEDVARLPDSGEYTAPGGWPAGGNRMWYGEGGMSDPLGQVSISMWPMQENPSTLLLEEGLYWLGAKGKSREGHQLFPVGTGLVAVGSGQHRLRFELAPAVAVEGRVSADAIIDLAVALAREGRLLELGMVGNELKPFRELGADGYFSFSAVPVGELELRVGTVEELASGGSSHRQPLHVDRDGVPFLEVNVVR